MGEVWLRFAAVLSSGALLRYFELTGLVPLKIKAQNVHESAGLRSSYECEIGSLSSDLQGT